MGERVSEFEGARLAIAKLGFALPMELVRSFERAAEVTGRTLKAERVGIWLMNAALTGITCVTCHELTDGSFVAGRYIELAAVPAYAAAIASRRIVVAGNALTDPRTAELVADYLTPLQIGAILDAPIFRNGEVAGIVCVEHCGGPRDWNKREADLVVSVAEMVGTMIQQAARLEAEAELRRVADGAALGVRMAALGRMAAGIAHDFSNVLTAIQLSAASLKANATSPERVALRAAEISQMADRGAALARQLLEFGKPRPGHHALSDPAFVLREMRPMLVSLLSGAWELEFLGDDLVTQIALERSELEQIVLNLVANARDAMPSGGRVTVALSCEGASCTLSVTDHGSGMDSVMLARAVEPFVTSKAPGAGTGLGLSVVYAIAQCAGATLDLESSAQRGTTARVKFQRVA
jgi:two-component system, cell cycle sensor histidine kinase and response regulator CckA